MDLIYMNPDKEDIGVLKDYTLDMAYGADENNFECTVSSSNNVCEAGFYLYAEGTEYGGIIDSINVDTESETVIYKGRTWHGIMESKVFEPDAGEDYLEVSGEANSVLSTLISRMGLGDMFTVSEETSEIEITHKMNRYVKGYTGILRMLKASGAKLNVIFKGGFVELSAEPLVDYNQDEQFDTDQISFTIEKNYKPINHVVCLGQGDLKDRRVIHLYADGVGNISGTQTFAGVDEVTEIFDYPNAESDEELIKGGVDIIKASWASDTIEFDFESDDESFDINDVIGAKEFATGTEVVAHITKKIIQIKDYTTSIAYSCESGVGTVASSGYPSSGSGSIVVDAYTKAETDALLDDKSNTDHTHSNYVPINSVMENGGRVSDDGNVYLNAHGYVGWLTNILAQRKNEREYHKGDSVTYKQIIDSSLSSYNAGNGFAVFVNLPKNIGSDVTSVSISGTLSWIRHQGGADNIGGATFSVDNFYNNVIQIAIKFSSTSLTYYTAMLTNVTFTFS